MKISGEVYLADVVAAEVLLPNFQELMEEQGYSPQQIYNANEMTLFFKMLPDHSLACKAEKSANHGHRQGKERLTLLLATNWSGCHSQAPGD